MNSESKINTLDMNVHFTSVQGRRESNEDKHNIIFNTDGKNPEINKMNLFGIYDGHGGNKVSKFLSKYIPECYFNKNFKPPFSQKFNENLFEHLQKNILTTDYGYSMGSTCLINIMYKDDKGQTFINVINLGDCRIVTVDEDGKFNQITTDHKPDDKIEKERIEKMGGDIYADTDGVIRIGDLSLSRSFGDGDNAPYVTQKPDTFIVNISNNTKYIVMGCDGLWDVIQNKDLFGLLEKYKKNNSDNFASELATESLKRDCTDNISIIIIEIN